MSQMELITALVVAQQDGDKTVKDRMYRLSSKMRKPWSGAEGGSAVSARIDFGRLIVLCPDCGGAEYVDPSYPFFYCCSCGNALTQGAARPVDFPDPETLSKILDLLGERPVLIDPRVALFFGPARAALTAVPAVPGLARCWSPEESLQDLEDQNAPLRPAGESPADQNPIEEVK